MRNDAKCQMLAREVLIRRSCRIRDVRANLCYSGGHSVVTDRMLRIADRLNERLASMDRVAVAEAQERCYPCQICGECAACNRCAKIHPYHHSPRWEPCSHTTLKYGFEMEFEVRRPRYTTSETEQRRDQIAHLLGRAMGTRLHLEHDGSLRWGIEAITHPECFDCAQRTLGKVGSLLRGEPVFATKTCGFHAHVGADRLSNGAVRRLRRLFGTRNAVFAKMLCGRLSPRYADLHDNDSYPGTRYWAVNTWTRNEKTVEFRLFKGTTRRTTLLRYVETVDALVRWANLGPQVPMLVEGFVNWVREREASYPLLNRHFTRNRVAGGVACA